LNSLGGQSRRAAAAYPVGTFPSVVIGSIFQFGGSEYTEGVGSDSFTTMSWSAQLGERADYDGSWDDSWMQRDEYADSPVHSEDFRGFSISVEDDDNELLFDTESNEDAGSKSQTEV
jgi:hypothetical protein